MDLLLWDFFGHGILSWGTRIRTRAWQLPILKIIIHWACLIREYVFRSSLVKRISSSTHKFTWGSPSRINVLHVTRHSPTAPTSRSTPGSISASSPTDVKYVSASSPSSHISSSTSGLTRATSPTSAEYQVNQTSEPIKTPREETRHDRMKTKCVYFFWFCKKSEQQEVNIPPSWPFYKKHWWKNYLLVKWRWKWRYRWQSAATISASANHF